MKCPHCNSTDLIEIAGQTYCSNCGQLVEAEHKKPGKPTHDTPVKTDAEDKPEAKVVTHAAPKAKPHKTPPPLNLKKIEESRSAKQTKAKPKPVASTRAAAITDIAGHPKHVAIKDESANDVSIEAQDQAKPDVAHEDDHRIISEPAFVSEPPKPHRPFSHLQALRDGFVGLKNGRILGLAFAGALLTTLCESLYLTKFGQTAWQAIQRSISAGTVNNLRLTVMIDHLGWAAILGFFGYLAYHYALGGVIFRSSRNIDRRSVHIRQVQRAALGSLSGLFAIDVITWAAGILSFILVAGANVGFLGTKSLGLVGALLAFLVNAVAVYVWFGLAGARHMATYAIVLGQTGVRRAYSTGWSLYNRRFASVVYGLIITSLTIMVLNLPSSLLQQRLILSGLAGKVSLILLATATQTLILIIVSVYLLRLYRYLIAHEYDAHLGHLLSGRQPQSTHVKKRIISLVVIAIVWLGAASLLILNAAQLAGAIT